MTRSQCIDPSDLAVSAALTTFITSQEPSMAGPMRAALIAAFPHMLRDFLWSDEARDVTGSWGHDNKSGDEFRNQLMDALASGQTQEGG